MKKVFKKIFLILTLIILILGSTKAFGLQVDTNKKEENKQYKQREIDFFGLILVYNDEMFFNGEETVVSLKQQNFNNYLIAGTCGVLVIYWIVLLYLFEKEDERKGYKKIDDIAILNKYNPMIAGCLADNRQVLMRDVMAIILNLVHKDYIKLEMIPNKQNDGYTYMISENKDKKGKLDELELYVLNWVFGFYEEERVDLIEKLKELSRRKDFVKHMNQLDSKAEKILHKLGANIPKVPKDLRVFNVFLMLFTIVLSIVHIINNGINIHIYQTTLVLLLFIIAFVLLLVPIVMIVLHLIVVFVLLIKKLVRSTAEKYSGKKIIQMASLIIFFMVIILAVMYYVLPNKYICLDIFMIGMSVLIVKTDNLMTKHNEEILEDYYALNDVKSRIEEYSLIKDEHINYMKLWDEYLIYAVAFGIPIPIVNKLKEAYQEDDHLLKLSESEHLYYAWKAYFDIAVDLGFFQQRNRYKILK